MDDANLSALKIKPPLEYMPPFHKDIIEYSLIVSSEINDIILEIKTSDSGASYLIRHELKDDDRLKLKDGLNTIKIEVSSEDGTIKIYTLNVKKLSASDAFLKSLTISNNLSLNPSFNSEIFDYNIENLASDICNLKLNAEVEDQKCEIKLVCNDNELIKTKETQLNVDLNYGNTKIELHVTSPDKTKIQKYSIIVSKCIIPCFIKYKNLNDFVFLEDPITLAPLFRPVSIQGIDNNYSQPFLQFFINQYKQDYLSGIFIENFNSSQRTQYKIDLNVSNVEASVPLLNGEYFSLPKIASIGHHLNEIKKKDQLKQNSPVKFVLDYDSNLSDTTLKYEIKKWEEKLFQIFDEFEPEKLLEHSKKHQNEYLNLIYLHDSRKIYEKENSPMYFLNLAIYACATAIKFKKQDHELHFRLAMLLEEKHFIEDTYGLKDEDSDDESLLISINSNQVAKNSSREEEINAICKLRNVEDTASVERKLKALDEEYHHLLQSGQTFKAEQVQSLYLFKVQTTKMDASISSKAANNETALGQAYCKYSDALGLSEASKITKYLYHFHMGRMQCIRSNAISAIKNLTICLQWNDEDYKVLVRFYLGYALSLDKTILEKRYEEAVFYLCSGLQCFIEKLSNNSLQTQTAKLHAENLFSLLNPTFLQAFFNIGSIVKSFKISSFNCISPTDSYHYCAWLCGQSLYKIYLKADSIKKLAKTSELIKQICWLLVGAHYALIELLESHSSNGKPLLMKLIEKRCFYLSALLKNINKNDNPEVLNLQETICQKLVKLNPSDNYFLFLLGNAQLEKYDSVNAKESDNTLLEECKNSLLASMQLEDKPANGEVSNLISEQNWWKELNKRIEIETSMVSQSQEKTTSESTKPQVPSVPQKPASTVKQPTKPIPKAGVPKVAASQPKNIPSKKPTEKPKSDPNCKHSKPAENKQIELSPPLVNKEQPAAESQSHPEKEIEKIPPEPVKINKKIISSRLVLARVYTRLKDIENAKKLYNQTLEMEPNNYDAAIELAEMLKGYGDVEGAVDVYTKFKTDFTTLTYDDAFIFGEIVNLLMKGEKYDDSRLIKYAILWAKVMGIGILDKYIKKLDEKNKVKACKEIYCGVHMKDINDPDLNQFFKFKGWNQ